jgi:hypothetical protein
MSGLLRPRFLIAAVAATTLFMLTIYHSQNKHVIEDSMLREFEFNHKATKYFNGTTDLSRRLQRSEHLYQKHVYRRNQHILKNSA